MSARTLDLRTFVRDVPDFPKKGIVFKDITPMLADAKAFAAAVEAMCLPFEGGKVDSVAGIESRGFLFAAAMAARLGVGVVPVRKKGKLPCKTVSVTYSLEYGTDTLELHADAAPKGARILVVDDVLATGGTAQAACELVEKLGAKVAGVSFFIELDFLKGRAKLGGRNAHSVLRY